MAQMHTLIINGQAYTLVDAAAARIDDSAVGENAWSSGQIVNRLCPSFAQRGSEVVCTPVALHPLRVVSHIEPVQEGTGDPSPENVRPIRGFAQVVLNQSNGETSNELTIDLGQTVYGGDLDWNTGLLTVDRKAVTLDGTEPWVAAGTNTAGKNRYLLHKSACQFLADVKFAENSATTDDKLLCSILPTKNTNATYTCQDAISTNQTMLSAYVEQHCADMDGFKAMMAGAQLVLGLAEPYTVQLTPQQILALAGTNRISSNTGDTDVSGKADPDAVIQDLSGKVNTLCATMTALTGV